MKPATRLRSFLPIRIPAHPQMNSWSLQIDFERAGRPADAIRAMSF